VKQKEMLGMAKKNLKAFWRGLQVRKPNQENNISKEQWMQHARKFYENIAAREKPPEIETERDVFMEDDVREGIQWLAPRKEKDKEVLQEEHLKWGKGHLS
jgi:hypothetical protein